MLPSPEELRNAAIALQLEALSSEKDREHEVVTAMKLFLNAIRLGTECEVPATSILDLMKGAVDRLEKFFPQGLDGLNEEHLIWKAAVVQFWDEFRPHGWAIQNDPDDRLRLFLIHYRQAATWLGLGHCLENLIATEPITAPVQIPAQTQQSLPMVHTPSWSTAQQNAAPTISNPLPSYPPNTQQHLPQPPPLSTQPPSAPKVQTQSFSFAFTANTLAPSYPVAQTSQSTPTTSAPIQQQPVQQPQATQGAPGLLDFNNNSWLNKPDAELKRLTWKSFGGGEETASKIWKYDVPELGQFPGELPKVVLAQDVKAKLENVAPHFKRAAIILRLQGRGCPKDDDLEMVPLLMRIYDFLKRAEAITNKCKVLAVWDSKDEWYQACLYFHNEVVHRQQLWN
jgi:hypothetical protein